MRKSVNNKELGVPEGGFDRFGGNQVITLICTTNIRAFSCLQIMNMSMREAAEWVQKALLVFDVQGDQKTTVGASSEEKSPENDVKVEIEKENLNLGR